MAIGPLAVVEGLRNAIEFIQSHPEPFKIGGAALAGAAGIWRYWSATAVGKAREASALIEKFAQDETNRAAMRMVDWSGGRFHSKIGDRWTEIRYDEEGLIKALEPHYPGRKFDLGEQIVRDTFDYFFNGLDRIEFLIKRDAVDKMDFDTFFKYWRDRIVGERDHSVVV